MKRFVFFLTMFAQVSVFASVEGRWVIEQVQCNRYERCDIGETFLEVKLGDDLQSVQLTHSYKDRHSWTEEIKSEDLASALGGSLSASGTRLTVAPDGSYFHFDRYYKSDDVRNSSFTEFKRYDKSHYLMSIKSIERVDGDSYQEVWKQKYYLLSRE